jgi:hypothetical protein
MVSRNKDKIERIDAREMTYFVGCGPIEGKKVPEYIRALAEWFPGPEERTT